MKIQNNYIQSEGLKVARLIMVLSSVSPVFVLWAVKGCVLIPDAWFIGFCAIMLIVPNTVLWLRIRTAKKQSDKRVLVVGKADDHRDHLLVYLFAMLLPFYSADINNWRYFATTLLALGFIIFLFWHLNLHYMNLLFAMQGYHIFTISPRKDNNPFSSRKMLVLITHRVSMDTGQKIFAYRLSDTVYLETDHET